MQLTKILQVINYFSDKIKSINKLKLIKLIYLLDKYHILNYGRLVTNDTYFAMKKGPVGSFTKDILWLNEFLSEEDKKLIKQYIYIDGHNVIQKKKFDDYDLLSESEIDGLNFVIDKFGKYSNSRLIDYTHEYPEWKQYEFALNEGVSSSVEIAKEDLVSVIKDNIFNVSEETLCHSREIVTGCFE